MEGVHGRMAACRAGRGDELGRPEELLERSVDMQRDECRELGRTVKNEGSGEMKTDLALDLGSAVYHHTYTLTICVSVCVCMECFIYISGVN